MMARDVFLTSWPRTPCLSTCNIMFRTRKTGWFLSHFLVVVICWNIFDHCLLVGWTFMDAELLSGHPTSSSLWSLFLDWFNYVVYDIIFIQSSTLLRFCRENNVWGFHLLFPFSRWPNSKAMMSEEERGETSIDIYSYIYIKMDLVQVTSSNVLMEQSRIRSTINERHNWCHEQKLISKCSWKVAPPGRMQAVTWDKF